MSARRAAAAGVPVAAAGLPLFIPCYFRLATGLPCPGCGLTRGALALARGDLAAAVAYHPLAPLFAVELATVLLVVAWRWGAVRWRGAAARGAAARGVASLRPPQRVIDLFLAANVGLLLAVWVGRLVTGTAPR